MIALVADENFNNAIVRGLLLRRPDLDLVRVQDVGLLGADDPNILEWAAGVTRIVLTHDGATMARFAYDRLDAGLPMPGVIEVRASLPIGRVIDDILLMDDCGETEEWEGQVVYLPL